jgi:GT2 family glycosyltransferase
MSDIDVSILIVNWNTRDLVLRCLDALPVGIDDDLTYEVIVVDNGSVDGSADALGRRSEAVLIRNAENLGFAAAVNQAYRKASGEFVLLLNSDVDLTPGAMSTLVRFLRNVPAAAGAAPLYVHPDGTPQPFHFRFPTFATTLISCSSFVRWVMPGSERRVREYWMADDDFSKPRPVPQPSASCLLLRRALLPRERIFDERYPIFFNDVQLARSFADRDLALWVVPEVTVVHDAHASTRMLGRAGNRQYLGSVVRMLEETESPAKVWLYRVVVFLQHVPLWIIGRPDVLGASELWKALSGDVGPLPAGPSRLDARVEVRTGLGEGVAPQGQAKNL